MTTEKDNFEKLCEQCTRHSYCSGETCIHFPVEVAEEEEDG